MYGVNYKRKTSIITKLNPLYGICVSAIFIQIQIFRTFVSTELAH